MSRGFVREGDQEEVPMVPPRAHLPVGVSNYVTPTGLKELYDEQQQLLSEQNELKEKDKESNRVEINFISAKLQLLNARINTAKVVDLSMQPLDEVRFGAKITVYKEEEKCDIQYQIVGVDEAKISENKVSFLSPIAKALINKKIGDKIILQLPKGIRKMQIKSIRY